MSGQNLARQTQVEMRSGRVVAMVELCKKAGNLGMDPH